MTVHVGQDDDIGYVTPDRPPVNAVGSSLCQGLRQAEAALLSVVIVAGAGRGLATGAEARNVN